jgi:nucleoside-diphosphate-sugar epimerase
MRFLVTGADGFVGSHVVESILGSPKDDVVAFVHRAPPRWLPTVTTGRLRVVEGDIVRAADVERAGEVDAIIHLAGIPSAGACDDDPETARLVNFQGTVNALNLAAAQDPPPRFVLVSTAALYGEAAYLPIDEGHPIDPRNQYMNTKLAAEMTAQAYEQRQGVPVVIVRSFNIYGPRQAEYFVVPTIVRQCLDGQGLTLGDGRLVRNFTFVGDAAEFLVRAAMARGAPGNVINLGSRSTISIEQLARKVVEMTGCGLEPQFELARFRDSDPTIHQMDPTLAERLLAWRPQLDLDRGLSITIEHYRAEKENAWKARALGAGADAPVGADRGWR